MLIKYVEYRNFMSVGNHAIKINLINSQNTVVGGANGSGKSSALGAITYCLFGKLLNNMRLGQAINSINKNNMLVECGFEKNGEEWKVVRGEKPKKFDIYRNGEKIEQYAHARDQQRFLETIMGMDFDTFTQLCAINKERYIPFMEMSAANRRKVVEDVLGVGVFGLMNEVLRDETRENKRHIDNLENEIKINNTKLEGIERLISQIKSSMEDSTAMYKEELEEAEKQIAELETLQEQLQKELNNCDYEQLAEVEKTLNDLSSIANEFERDIKALEKEVIFYTENSNCPTCEQPITKQFRENKTKKATEKIKEINDTALQLISKTEEKTKQKEDLSKIKKRATELEAKIISTNTSLKQLIRHKQTASAKIKQAQDNSKSNELTSATNEYNELEKHVAVQYAELKQKHEKQSHYDVVRNLLADDGIKSLIVKDYNTVMNKKINEYLNTMGFYVNVTIDENFNETFHSMNREGFSYNNLSSGQKMRLNIAITLALLEVASIKNSVVCNLLWCDELLEPLDTDGVSDVAKLFKEKLYDKNVFVATQRYDEFVDQFDASIKFKIENNFTTMQENV